MTGTGQYVIIDPENNAIVMQQGATERTHSAYLTNLFSLLIAMEARTHNDTKFGDTITIPRNLETRGLESRVTPGKTYPVDIVFSRAGDTPDAKATLALAHHLAKDSIYGWGGNGHTEIENNFLDFANTRLQEIGLTDTNMRVIAGAGSHDHHTTPLDIAIAMDYMQSNFPRSVGISLSGQTRNRHSSAMVSNGEAEWGKTGWLTDAGYSHALYIEREGKPLIVVMTDQDRGPKGDRSKFAREDALELLDQAYDIINSPDYNPEGVYEDVTFDPAAPLPGTNQRADNVIVQDQTTPLPDADETTESVIAQDKDAKPAPLNPAAPLSSTNETANNEIIEDEDLKPLSEEIVLPMTPDGYIDLSKILPEDIPIPTFAPLRTDPTIRFPICDAPELPISDHMFKNAPMLKHAFSDTEPTKPPETDQEMFDAVYSIGLREKMIEEEDIRNDVYEDSEGYLTVGIGHLLGDNGDPLLEGGPELKEDDVISDLCVDRLFEHDVTKAINAAIAQARDIGRFQKDFVVGLVSVNFQLGENWPNEWEKAYAHMKAGDFPNAMVEVMSNKTGRGLSKWSQQTPYRAINLLKVLAQEANEDIRADKTLATTESPEPTTPDTSGPTTKN